MCINRPLCRLDVKPFKLAPNRVVRINTPENNIRICNSRAMIPKTVCNRTGIRPRAFWSDVQKVAFINPRDGSTTSPDCSDFDHWRSHDHSKINRGLRREHRLTVCNQRDVKTCSTHIAGDNVIKPRTRGDIACGNNPCRWTRKCRANWMCTRRVHRHNAAV